MGNSPPKIRKDQEGSKLVAHLPPDALCRCGKVGGPPGPCPLSEIYPEAPQGMCRCCDTCRSACADEV